MRQQFTCTINSKSLNTFTGNCALGRLGQRYTATATSQTDTVHDTRQRTCVVCSGMPSRTRFTPTAKTMVPACRNTTYVCLSSTPANGVPRRTLCHTACCVDMITTKQHSLLAQWRRHSTPENECAGQCSRDSARASAKKLTHCALQRSAPALLHRANTVQRHAVPCRAALSCNVMQPNPRNHTGMRQRDIEHAPCTRGQSR